VRQSAIGNWQSEERHESATSTFVPTVTIDSRLPIADSPHPSRSRKSARRFYFFVAPWLIGVVLLQAGPMLAAVGISLTDWQLSSNPQWRGLLHYRELLEDPLFRIALKNTLYYSAASVPLGIALAFGLALLLNRRWAGMDFFRTVFFMPAMVSGVAIALVWGWLFNPRFGAVNALLRDLHLPEQGWLADPHRAMPTLILLSLWSVGGTMLVYLAGLQNIPRELYDAARLDGANTWQLTRFITLPLISPVTYFLMVTATIASFQLFTPTYVLTGGGPKNSTLTLPLYIYQNAFKWQKLGYASTLTVVLVALTLLVTLLQVGMARRWVFYTGWSGR
jgi:multiple sugar transport system permease protein